MNSNYIFAELALSSVMIVVKRRDCEQIAKRIEQYFKETSHTNLYVFLQECCLVYTDNGKIDHGLYGYFEVTSAEGFISIVKNHRDEYHDPNVPSVVVEFGCKVGELYSITDGVEYEYKRMMDAEYEKQYKQYEEELEFEQWREENFDADGEYIGPDFI